MNPSTACARVIVDELIRLGCQHVVLCPGSRSAPLAYALAEADAAGQLTLHVRVDERSAAYLALGLAKATRIPAPVVTTSGTAVANLHPAVLEADAASVPLMVLSADRPPELRGTGANQTTDQVKMYGTAVRWSHDLGVAEWRGGQQGAWRTAIDRAWAASTGALGTPPGPVQVNVPFRDPLAPEVDGHRVTGGTVCVDSGDTWPELLEGRADSGPWTQVAPAARGPWWEQQPRGDVDPLSDEPRTLVVLGDVDSPGAAQQVLSGAHQLHWPVLAEPFGRRIGTTALPHGPSVLSVPGVMTSYRPDRILVVGRPTLSRPVAALLRTPGVRVESVSAGPRWADPSHVTSRVSSWAALLSRVQAGIQHERTLQDQEWFQAWQQAGERVAQVVAPLLTDPQWWPSGPAIAHEVLSSLPAGSTLFVGSSNSARDLDVARCGDNVDVYAGRGLAGIDGNVSTAMGMALAGQSPTYALVGDLTFFHDLNALLMGPHEVHPNLTVVVVDDNGGGIFGTLEYGEPVRAGAFERVFATPVVGDLAAAAAAYGAQVRLASTREELRAALAEPPQGMTVVRVAVDRHDPLRSPRAVRERFRLALEEGNTDVSSR
ncbi:2-succinyl-5-enolpyruvyl-6-hydroxy-3-cyclohexene-1-carboxylate synthase [Austwickia sp. TVS 96-490-7B]|uniref:2-succinyl-5-enolpyruvyl-6-hydroxy-3- cyclohexene-1-carboxylic-acid synthase n=1 Tax=Austwickia sp. TVS 96-490-7B TaxID=2830843 RepID=UPI001C583A51|nr:2-succinyl-5-enolpyruvyl-6-hydroxy-3-cyclohexene-1-carboxylic-acid synthase [Austwickia sp. TVS 96-490-7B]MBW3085659.1 2-succinyl-5-enolpyruvyl-6-hydroxy-3-cyclohexene-1-carboxylate synthase [Austwickia sp. TVS 96-490-7B]